MCQSLDLFKVYRKLSIFYFTYSMQDDTGNGVLLYKEKQCFLHTAFLVCKVLSFNRLILNMTDGLLNSREFGFDRFRTWTVQISVAKSGKQKAIIYKAYQLFRQIVR